MKVKRFIGKVVNWEQKRSSIYGNPCRQIWFDLENGERVVAKTASDYSFVYGLGNITNKWYAVEYHLTRNDRVIITDMVEIEVGK